MAKKNKNDLMKSLKAEDCEEELFQEDFEEELGN